MKTEQIVITGVGALSSLGLDAATNWENLLKGKSGISDITRFDASQFHTRFAGEIKDFDPASIGDRKEIKKMDRLSWYALSVVKEAITQSGIETSGFDRSRAGVVWASGNGGMETIDHALIEFAHTNGKPAFSPFFQSKALLDSPSGWIAQRHHLTGPNLATVAACASSNSAIMTAMVYMKAGLCDVMIAGGSEAPITPSVVGGFGAMKALATKNDSPQSASRPFDAHREGFVLAEGAGALVLETLSHALKRNAPILAVLSGCGNANDAGHHTSADIEGKGTAASVNLALEMAGISISEIDAINPHATSTHNGDLAEYKGYLSVFGDRLAEIPLSATKCMTGHLLGAAGALEAVICVKSIQDQCLSPVINFETPDPEIEPGKILIPKEALKMEIRHILSHSAGFGGHNATAVFSRFSKNS